MTRKKNQTSSAARLAEEFLPPEQSLLFAALREEFNAKMSSLKAWGIVALFGGQVVAGVFAAYVGPSHAYHAAVSALHPLA